MTVDLPLANPTLDNCGMIALLSIVAIPQEGKIEGAHTSLICSDISG